MLRRSIISLTVAWLSIVGCGDSQACLVGSDCPSGACRADGTCESSDDGTETDTDMTTGGAASSSDDADDGVDDIADSSEEEGDDSGGVACMPPNADGLVERDEYPAAAGLSAPFLVAQDVAFNTAGTQLDTGLVWNFDVQLTGDHDTVAETLALEGRWFEPLFPGASYASRLTDADDLLGVFEATDTALLLRGVVSPTDGLTRTELTYEPPVTVLSFPLLSGQAWTSETTVSGLALGVVALYTEAYSAAVDAEGTVITSFAEFPALRVNIGLTRTIGLLVTTLRTHTFVSECFGTIAQVRSGDNEDGVEFTQAAEVRRLAP